MLSHYRIRHRHCLGVPTMPSWTALRHLAASGEAVVRRMQGAPAVDQLMWRGDVCTHYCHYQGLLSEICLGQGALVRRLCYTAADTTDHFRGRAHGVPWLTHTVTVGSCRRRGAHLCDHALRLCLRAPSSSCFRLSIEARLALRLASLPPSFVSLFPSQAPLSHAFSNPAHHLILVTLLAPEHTFIS